MVDTTVNSTTTTLDDPIMTLGGDTAPGSDDNKDRGIEFNIILEVQKLDLWVGMTQKKSLH